MITRQEGAALASIIDQALNHEMPFVLLFMENQQLGFIHKGSAEEANQIIMSYITRGTELDRSTSFALPKGAA